MAEAVEGIGTSPDNGPLRSGRAVSAFPSGIALKVAVTAGAAAAATQSARSLARSHIDLPWVLSP